MEALQAALNLPGFWAPIKLFIFFATIITVAGIGGAMYLTRTKSEHGAVGDTVTISIMSLLAISFCWIIAASEYHDGNRNEIKRVAVNYIEETENITAVGDVTLDGANYSTPQPSGEATGVSFRAITKNGESVHVTVDWQDLDLDTFNKDSTLPEAFNPVKVTIEPVDDTVDNSLNRR